MITEWTYEEPHPGALLTKRFLDPLGVSAEQLARDLRMGLEPIKALLRGEGRIDLSLARRLAGYFQMRAGFWLGVQAHYDAQNQPFADADRIGPLPLEGFVVGVGGVVPIEGEAGSEEARPRYVTPEERIADWPNRTP